MQQKYPSLLANYRPIVQKADLGAKGTWYRLRIGPITDKTAASKLCTQLKSQGLPDCLVMAAQ
jgi:cell division protein FtsN